MKKRDQRSSTILIITIRNIFINTILFLFSYQLVYLNESYYNEYNENRLINIT
jgi:hypothetical protein